MLRRIEPAIDPCPVGRHDLKLGRELRNELHGPHQGRSEIQFAMANLFAVSATHFIPLMNRSSLRFSLGAWA